jgi:uncharacterized protein (TIGR02246 family)
MRARTRFVLTVLPFLGTACATKPDDAAATAESAADAATATSTDAGEARQAIEAGNARFIDANKRGDTSTVAANYADDAIVMMPNMTSWRGRDAVRRGFAGFLSQAAVKDLTLKTEDVAVTGDVAVETGSYEMTLQPRSGKEIKDKGKYITVWKRQGDGSWKIVRDINNSDLPMAH